MGTSAREVERPAGTEEGERRAQVLLGGGKGPGLGAREDGVVREVEPALLTRAGQAVGGAEHRLELRVRDGEAVVQRDHAFDRHGVGAGDAHAGEDAVVVVDGRARGSLHFLEELGVVGERRGPALRSAVHDVVGEVLHDRGRVQRAAPDADLYALVLAVRGRGPLLVLFDLPAVDLQRQHRLGDLGEPREGGLLIGRDRAGDGQRRHDVVVVAQGGARAGNVRLTGGGMRVVLRQTRSHEAVLTKLYLALFSVGRKG